MNDCPKPNKAIVFHLPKPRQACKLGPIPPEEFKNDALLLRLGQPSTLNCYENEACQKRAPNRRNLKLLVNDLTCRRKAF